MRPLKHGDILGQVLFMDTPESTQEVAQAGPNAFQRVAMNLPYPIAIIIPGILANGMTHRPVPATCAGDVIVGTTFIGVEGAARLGATLNFGLDCGLLRIIADLQADLTRLTPNNAQDGRAVILFRAFPRTLVGSPAGRIVRFLMGGALYIGVLLHLIRCCRFIRQIRVRFVN